MKYIQISAILATAIIFSGCDSISKFNNDTDSYDNKKFSVNKLKSAIDNGEVKDYSPDNTKEENFLAVTNYIRSLNIKCDDSYGFSGPATPLKWDYNIEDAAQVHSDDMSNNNQLSHYGSDGSSPKERMQRFGYNGSRYGENIAYIKKSDSYSNSDWLQAFDLWINSTDGHCSNLMSPNYKDTAMAESKKVENGITTIYWTQNFGAK